MKNKIEEAIVSYDNEIIEFLKKLIEIPTVNPPGEFYKECIDVIACKLREIGLTYNILQTHVATQARARRELIGLGYFISIVRLVRFR